VGRSLVVTVIGDDRPGIVETLSRTITGHGANWLESRMARLAGKFAGVLRVEVAEAGEAALREALIGLAAEGLRVVAEPSAAAAEPAARGVTLELVGTDHPGIVRAVSRTLAAHGVNVEELVTELVDAPMSGEQLFRASARLHLPERTALDTLRTDLERIAGDLMVDIRLDEREGPDSARPG
jgi:glycine cleavage system regulatory protein